MTKLTPSVLGILFWLGLVNALGRHDAAFYLITAMFAAFITTVLVLKFKALVDEPS